jgi:hypothetical protein
MRPNPADKQYSDTNSRTSTFFVITLDNRWKSRKPEITNFDNDEYCSLYESTKYLHETIDMKQFQPVVVNYGLKRKNSFSKPTNLQKTNLTSPISGKEAGRTIH